MHSDEPAIRPCRLRSAYECDISEASPCDAESTAWSSSSPAPVPASARPLAEALSRARGEARPGRAAARSARGARTCRSAARHLTVRTRRRRARSDCEALIARSSSTSAASTRSSATPATGCCRHVADTTPQETAADLRDERLRHDRLRPPALPLMSKQDPRDGYRGQVMIVSLRRRPARAAVLRAYSRHRGRAAPCRRGDARGAAGRADRGDERPPDADRRPTSSDRFRNSQRPPPPAAGKYCERQSVESVAAAMVRAMEHPKARTMAESAVPAAPPLRRDLPPPHRPI